MARTAATCYFSREVADNESEFNVAVKGNNVGAILRSNLAPVVEAAVIGGHSRGHGQVVAPDSRVRLSIQASRSVRR